MTLLGVPGPQIAIEDPSGGLTAYQGQAAPCADRAAGARELFRRVYITGSPWLLPGYLRREHQSVLQARRGRIRTHTDTLSGFLRRHPGAYSHYVLLDHQDWLAWHAPEALEEEWDLILRNSRPGTRILLRSAALEVDFIPDAARERLRFFPERTGPLHGRDRVGTYGCQVLAEVR
jgi:S-adenosylmethionine-diacylglycerol 3-amino-3-carboxypropyl transferase